MKYAKMLSLVAVAAFAVMAFVGVSSAAASKVCSTSGTGAACGTGHGNELTTESITAETTTASGQKATLTSGFVRVTCDSHIVISTEHTPGVGKITSLTWTNCDAEDSGLGKCTASTTILPTATAVASGKNDGNGTMTTGEVAGEFTCAGTTCKYGAGSTGTKGEIVVTGGETASVTATNVPLNKLAGSGFLCSSTANWDGTYEVITPDSLFIT